MSEFAINIKVSARLNHFFNEYRSANKYKCYTSEKGTNEENYEFYCQGDTVCVHGCLSGKRTMK